MGNLHLNYNKATPFGVAFSLENNSVQNFSRIPGRPFQYYGTLVLNDTKLVGKKDKKTEHDYSERRGHVNFHNPDDKAKYNIQRGNGFQCPTCTRNIPRGYDVCPNCGDMPALRSYSGAGYVSSRDPADIIIGGCAKSIGWLILMGLSYYFHWVATLGVGGGENPLNTHQIMLVMFPNFLILWIVFNSLLHRRKLKLFFKGRVKVRSLLKIRFGIGGLISLAVRLYVLYYSVKTFWYTSRYAIRGILYPFGIEIWWD